MVKDAILNWFDVTTSEDYLSLNDKMGDVLSIIQGRMLFLGMFGKMLGGKKGEDGNEGDMMDMKFTKEQLLDINAKLNKIKASKRSNPEPVSLSTDGFRQGSK